MKTDHLLQYFNRVCDAPNAMPHLRRFILDLAMRGKLTEQDPADEPAPQLLKRIEAETQKLVRVREARPLKELPPIEQEPLPYPLPHGWVQTRLGAIATCLDFRRIPVNSEERLKRIEGKKANEVYPYYGATQQQGWIDEFLFDEEIVLLGEDGVPFHDPLRAKAYLVSGKSWVNNHAHVFRGILISNAFLVHWLNAFDYSGRVVGATRAKLNQSRALDIPVPLPPLAEQQRIVARIEELMALCDELESVQATREERRNQLLATTLHRLNGRETETDEAGDPTFKEGARFFFNHLPRFTSRPEHIKQLRQAIVNLAVRGRLVLQESNAHSVAGLLSEIKTGRTRITDALGLRTQPAISVGDITVPFDLPNGWVWSLMDNCFVVTGGIQKTPKRTPHNNAFPYVGVGNVYRGRLDLSDVKQFELAEGELEKWRLEPNDLLIVEGNGSASEVGRCAIWTGEMTDCVHQNHIIRCRPGYAGIAQFVALYLNSDVGIAVMKNLAVTSAGLYNLSVEKIRKIRIPLPAMPEQQRIVVRVNQLMSLLDDLEAGVTSTSIITQHLLLATLSEAVAG